MEMREEPLGSILRVVVSGRLTADCAENFKWSRSIHRFGHNEQLTVIKLFIAKIPNYNILTIIIYEKTFYIAFSNTGTSNVSAND